MSHPLSAGPGTSLGPRVAPTFLDPQLEAQLRRDGYAVVRIFDDAAVAEARRIYAETAPATGEGFQNDFDRLSPADRAQLSARVQGLWDRLEQVFVDHHAFLINYLVKWPGPASEVEPHQDWTYVDEARFSSLAVLIALEDISPELDNGPLAVIPGSHRIAMEHRGTRTEPWYASIREDLVDQMVTVSLSAGEAAVLDNRVIHGSPPNRSTQPRHVLASAVAPRAAQLIHATAASDAHVTIHEIDDDFFRRTSPAHLWADPLPPATAATIVPRLVAPPALHAPGIHDPVARLRSELEDRWTALRGEIDALSESLRTWPEIELLDPTTASRGQVHGYVVGDARGQTQHPGLPVGRALARAHPDTEILLVRLATGAEIDLAGRGASITVLGVDVPGYAGSLRVTARDGAAVGVVESMATSINDPGALRHEGPRPAVVLMMRSTTRPLRSLWWRRGLLPPHPAEVDAAVSRRR